MEIKSKLIQRIVIWKAIWLIFWGVAFFLIPLFFKDADLFLRFWVWLWYITLWALIWMFWIITSYPFLKFKISFWFRWALLWAWMNFMLTLFIFNNLTSLIQTSVFQWASAFSLIIEWIIFWLVVDYFATKYAWEWKNIL